MTDQQISKWAQDYEKDLCARFDLLCDRISIAIISNVATYELPNYVTNIRSVLYKGKELHPKGGRSSILTGDIPFATSQTAPYEYQTSGFGLRVLRLLPTPGDTIPVYNGDLFTVDADKNSCIIEFYRTAHYDDFDKSRMLPSWCRRYLLKDQVCWKFFSSEGPDQDLRAAQFYQTRLKENETYLLEIRGNLNSFQQRVLSDNKMIGRRKPGRPVLPPTFGYPTYGG